MEKRVHHKHAADLTMRHYLSHFKRPLLALLFLLIFISYNSITWTYSLFDTDAEFDLNIFYTDVIYPIHISKDDNSNVSIAHYFQRKDELKAADDVKSVRNLHKSISPMPTSRSASAKPYTILEFTPVFQRPRFCSHKNEDIFGKTCPYTNCEYTCDLKRENETDVLLMHKRDLNLEQLRTMKRNPEQIWLLWHDESNEDSPDLNQFKFNWTITYRTSAEASLAAYGITIVKPKPWSKNQLNSWINEQFNYRQNQAVWFVSNCRPQKRLARFRSLREHYPIAAFGKCIPANQSFSLNAQSQSQAGCGRQSSCEKLYLSNSKFYLAFESQTCTDYITEKFWRTLAVGAIPIVSGPERDNFARVAPPQSFIHVDDYASDAELAHALDSIARNRTTYRQYHAWRQFYDVLYDAKDVDPYRFCELCYRLNTNQQRIWYENINDWFLEKC